MAKLISFSEEDFPLSIVYQYRIRTASKVIYISVLLAVMIALGALPFIHTRISVKGDGVLQAAIERSELTAPVSGRIIRTIMKDNKNVVSGDTLIIIDATLEIQQKHLIDERYRSIYRFLGDIKQLMKYSGRTLIDNLNLKLVTSQYNASWEQFSLELLQKRHMREQAHKNLTRYTSLYKNNVISLAEFEKFSFEYDHAVSEYSLLINRYKSQWQAETLNYNEELRKLKASRTEIEQQQKLYIILAPFSGSLQNLTGLQAGSYVFANQRIAEISPDAQLTAYCFIKPANIGMIKVGQQINFQMHAFDYSRWGLLSGEVLDISDDIILINNTQPVFKVKCSLDKNYLELSNNTKGYLKKGMNFTARFNIADRSLFQLLYDKAEDWVDHDFQERIN
jgi:HlyD family secretion protein